MMSTLCLNPLCQVVCKRFYCNENKKVTLGLTTEKQTIVVQRMSEEGVGVGGVREALLISLERTNTLSAYVYRDIRYSTTGIIQIVLYDLIGNSYVVLFLQRELLKLKPGGGGGDFYTYTRTTLQKTKNWPCQRRRHFTANTTTRKRILQSFVFLCKIRAFVI